MYFLLFYDYVENIIERRAPHRQAHFDFIQGYVERGELLLGGALDAPVDGAVLAFKTDDQALVEQFVQLDPYVNNGLVSKWSIRPWTVVVGCAMSL
jgi:uncharacterized protein